MSHFSTIVKVLMARQDCEDVREVYGLMKEFSERTAPGAYLADTLPPIAEMIPPALQWWRTSALQSYQRQERIWLKYWNTLQQQMKKGKAPECFVKQWAETDYKKQGIDDVQAAFVAGSKYNHPQLPAIETDHTQQ